MIISCKKCNKKFELEDKLVPLKGRLVQCGSCQNTWHQYPNENENNKQDDEKIQLTEKKEIKIKKEQNKQKSKIKDINDFEKSEHKVKKQISFFNILLVFIITIIALIILIDTFKEPINSILPNSLF